MRTPIALKVAALGAGLVAAPAAHALEMEFYTYNAFEETVAGFQRVALVLQDPGFLVFALVFAVLGTLVGLLTTAAKGVMGQQINPISVLIPVAIGIAIFRGLIIPTGTLHIYDPVRNAYQPVGDVPDAVILIAGVLNKIERGVVEIVETASADPAAERSGSLRYSLVLNALTSKRQDTYFERNSSIYFTECGFPSMGMGYNGASLDSLLRSSTDLINEWEKWNHPSIFATVYSGTGDQKVTMSCRDVWNNVLKPTATATAQFAEMVESVCRKVGFDPSVATQATRCEEELTSLQELYGVVATGSLSFVRSIVFAASVTDAMRDGDISVQQGALVNRQVMAEGFGAAEAMDRWVPKLRGFMTATVLGLIPLVCLFMLTPVMGKALSLAIGLFLWLALWGVTDAISVQMAADAAADAFDEIRRFGLSYDSLILSPEAAIQSLGVFGKARTMALMLATVLSYGLFSFGGYAFTSMAQAWQSDLQQAGESAGRTVLSPEERGALMSRLAATPSGEASIAAGGFQNAAYATAAGGLRTLGGVMSDRAYVSGSLQSNALPGGAGGTDTTPTETTPMTTGPGGVRPGGGDDGARVSGRSTYVSDRLSGVSEDGASLKPGGAGGTDTTPGSSRPNAMPPADNDPSRSGWRDAPVFVGGAGGVESTPGSTRPNDTAPSEFGRTSTPPSVGSALVGGAGGVDTTPRVAASRDLRRESAPLSAPTDGEVTLPDVTVTGGGYRPDNPASRYPSVAALNMAEGMTAAADGQGRQAAMNQLAENRGVSVDTAARDVSTTRTSREANRTEAYRERMEEDRTAVSEGGALEGTLDYAQYSANRRVFGNVNGGEDLSAEAAQRYGALDNASRIGPSEVVDPEQYIENYSTQTVITTEATRAINERDGAPLIGATQGASQVADARAFDRGRRAFGSEQAGEAAIVAGRAAGITSNASYGATLEQLPGGTAGNARHIGEMNATADVARRSVVERTREAIGEVPSAQGRVRVQEALQGNQSVVLNSQQTTSLIDNTPELELRPDQRMLIEGSGVRANIGVTNEGLVSADFGTGTSVSRSSTARDDYSFGIQGGTMAVPHLQDSLVAITGGDPIHGALDSAKKWTVISAIEGAIEATGFSVSASKSESEQLAGGVGGEAGYRMGSPIKGAGGSGGIGVQGSFTGTLSDQSSTNVNGTRLEAERILDESRQSVLADYERKLGRGWEASVTSEQFATAWNERIETMTAESAARFRQHGARAFETHAPVEKGEEARNQEERPTERKYSDRELAYMGGQQP